MIKNYLYNLLPPHSFPQAKPHRLFLGGENLVWPLGGREKVVRSLFIFYN